jgi:thioredoxin-like negative regulator of GroEL
MKFLTSEIELNINKKVILCFYSSELCDSISAMFFDIISEIQSNIEILCIDIIYFNNIGKRFGIIEIPSLILIDNGKELNRITGLLSKKDLDLFLNRK